MAFRFFSFQGDAIDRLVSAYDYLDQRIFMSIVTTFSISNSWCRPRHDVCCNLILFVFYESHSKCYISKYLLILRYFKG